MLLEATLTCAFIGSHWALLRSYCVVCCWCLMRVGLKLMPYLLREQVPTTALKQSILQNSSLVTGVFEHPCGTCWGPVLLSLSCSLRNGSGAICWRRNSNFLCTVQTWELRGRYFFQVPLGDYPRTENTGFLPSDLSLCLSSSLSQAPSPRL